MLYLFLLSIWLLCCSAYDVPPLEDLKHFCNEYPSEQISSKIETPWLSELSAISKSDFLQLYDWVNWERPEDNLFSSTDFPVISAGSLFDIMLKIEKWENQLLNPPEDSSELINVINKRCLFCHDDVATHFFDGCGATFCQECYSNYAERHKCPNCRKEGHKIFDGKNYLLNTAHFPFTPYLKIEKKTDISSLVDMAITALNQFKVGSGIPMDRRSNYLEMCYFLFSYDLTQLKKPWIVVKYFIGRMIEDNNAFSQKEDQNQETRHQLNVLLTENLRKFSEKCQRANYIIACFNSAVKVN